MNTTMPVPLNYQLPLDSPVPSEASAALQEVEEQLRVMLTVVATGESDDWTHAAMESWIVEQGREFQRRFLQAMFVLRSAREAVQKMVIGADGIERTHKRHRGRGLTTVVGDVDVRRLAYGAPEERSLMPLDEELGLPSGKYSHGLKKLSALEAIRGSFSEAGKSVERQTGVHVPHRQLQQLVRSSAADFEAFYESQRRPPNTGHEHLLILTVDGKGVVMRQDGLREATRKAAETSTPKMKTRTSKGEKRNRKRMATVASVYDIAPFVRAAEEVLDPPDDVKRPRPTNKRAWARLDVPMKKVVADMFDEAAARDPDQKRRWVVLVDGDKNQLRLVHKEARRRKVNVVVIVDLIHVLEYLWGAAWNFFEAGDPAAEAWVHERAVLILRGRAPHVAAGIRRSATLRQLEERGGADKCADYLLRKKRFLRYDEALAEGIPIATGVIEGTCRHLINDRLDITGARWGLDGAEAVLRLRSIWASGDFETYWDFHIAREQERTYGESYALAAS